MPDEASQVKLLYSHFYGQVKRELVRCARIARSLTELVASSAPFARELGFLCPSGMQKRRVIFPATCPAAYAFVVAMVAQKVPDGNRVWVVADSLPVQERICAEFPIWSNLPCHFIPEQEWQVRHSVSDPDVTAERLDALFRLTLPHKETQVVVVTTVGLDDPVPNFVVGKTSDTLNLEVGQTDYTPSKLVHLLEKHGFERVDQVTARHQWSLRGGILDVFPLQTAAPLRIEYMDDAIESLRSFDVDSQLSFNKVQEADLLLEEPEEHGTLRDRMEPGDVTIALPGCGETGTVIILENPPENVDPKHPLYDALQQDDLSFFPTPLGSFESGDFVMQEARRAYVQSMLKHWREEKWRLVMYFFHDGEQKRFEEICGDDPAWNAVQARIGELPCGFSVPSAKLVVLSAAELFGRHPAVHRRAIATREARMRAAQVQTPLSEIEPGDLVIHASHGLGRFLGIIRSPENQEEELHIQYAGNVLLRVPLSQAHLVSKYIGLGSKPPELNRVGDARWQRACKAAERAVEDYAAQLLEVQAQRESKPGNAHPVDSTWMWQFESSFPYRETPDQLRAIQDTKADMETDRPMDRLICGDVGFGKTEVALRAAFKCVTGGRQAVILAPTTVLADQHYRTFRERMSEYPVRIELLSRFTPAKRVPNILAGLRDGSVDIVIGTHRLLSKDVTFHNLGLAVIDEEQRFGVRHKDQFKRMFHMVDMLTLSATPIPRTLYVALMGARDMSTINTPPPDRLPVQTAVCPYSEDLIKRAIERELERKGQVFFLHNRVQSIERMEGVLHRLVPRARIVTGHGQMDKAELERIMRDFVAGKADVLLSTTIIESGIDIPNANTIIIDRADRFGLADLYQLRGRVGRSSERAYAYLLLPEKDYLYSGDARRRVSAIKQYTDLGSGFKIAMRDLEIRGAGNLLGTQQSGHIAAIGFDLYCRLLRQSVDRLRGRSPSQRADTQVKADFLCMSEAAAAVAGDTALGAFIPSSYVGSVRARMECYTALAQVGNLEEIDSIQRAWKDRFGILPEQAENLLLLQKIRVLAAHRGISMVEISGQKLLLTRNNEYILLNKRFPRLQSKKPAEQLQELRRLLSTM